MKNRAYRIYTIGVRGMKGKGKQILAVMLAAGMLAGLCGCAAGQTSDKNTKDVSENKHSGSEKAEPVRNRNWFCTAKDLYYVAKDENHVVQRSLSGNSERDYKIKNAELLSVEENWIYYYSTDNLYRVPVLHEAESDRLDLEHTEKLLQGGWEGDPDDILVTDSGLIYQPEWEEEVWYYDFASQKKKRCMKDLLAQRDKVAGIEFVAASGPYAVITVEFYDSKASYGSVYCTYRYDVKRDKTERLPGPAILRDVSSQTLLFGENLIIETWGDEKEEPELIQYNIKQNAVRTLLTRKQFDEIFQKKIQPGVSQKQIGFTDLSSVFSDDGKRIYVEYEVLWHKGTEYHMRNYVVSVSREDGSVRYEDSLSQAMAKAVEPRKLLWTNNYDAKKDCLFFAHDVCVVEIYNGNCLLHAISKEKGKERGSWFSYDLKTHQMREISREDNAAFYGLLRDGVYRDDESWEESGCLESWPNKMEYEELEK